MVSLEVGSRFRLPTGELVEVVPHAKYILGLTEFMCPYCYLYGFPYDVCYEVQCLRDEVETNSDIFTRLSMGDGLPRILKLVEE